MTLLERLDPTRTWLGFLGAAGAGLTALFVFLEPSPTYGLSLLSLIGFWGVHVLAFLALAQGSQILISRHIAPSANPWVAIMAAGIAASALLAPLALGMDRLMVEPVDLAVGDGWSWQELAEEWLNLAPPATLVWLGLNAVRFVRLPQREAHPSPVLTHGRAEPDFLRRLPLGRRGELIALSAELHYLRVYTTLGDSLILQGFGEALEQLGPDAGLRIHRSHWVDPSFVEELSREGGRTHVRLVNGVVLPVARSRRGEVAATLIGEGAPVRA
ncbi:LytTR family DNA-binding domain-containing protein [Brevundimonas bacteroides]|uniref:LytTR family DNA-binding domain-containing protein n=1 Tax=Brevundimonas bacteroides TaxID=74311 RepID=UPI000689DC9A|nr:LytTR family DNA-binding domain-containing protein [Brevundimonas bacteroides]